VTTVTATDPDAGQTLSYSIGGGADGAKFAIASSTGVLSFATAPNFEAPTDAGGNNVYDEPLAGSDNAPPIAMRAVIARIIIDPGPSGRRSAARRVNAALPAPEVATDTNG
jgi:hypothetical protein